MGALAAAQRGLGGRRATPRASRGAVGSELVGHGQLVAKLERQHSAQRVDLPTRAAELCARYGLPRPASIRWVANQRHRWGSCTPETGEIRISDRIAGFPGWVLDAVIVHELAHLVHLHHTPEFWALANRYPRIERAYGFLIAKQMTGDEVDLG